MPSIAEELSQARLAGYTSALRMALGLLRDPQLTKEQIEARLHEDFRKTARSPVKG
jgi:hypothetical protein